MNNSIKVSTMTAITSISTCIDIPKLFSYIIENELSMEQNNTNNNNNIGVIRHPLSRDKKLKEFKNQVQLHLPLFGDNGKLRQIKIKVFNNGRLHVTGSQSIEMVKQVLTHVNLFLKEANVVDDFFTEDVIYSNIDIVMINTTIDAGFCINQRVFREILVSKYNIYAEFSPKTYAGINAHFEIDGVKQASLLIFQSGKINIAGAKGMKYLDLAKSRIFDILEIEKCAIQLN